MLVPGTRNLRVADERSLDGVAVLVVVVVDAGHRVGRVRQVDIRRVEDLAVAEHALVARLHAGVPIFQMSDPVESRRDEVADVVAHGPSSAGRTVKKLSAAPGTAWRTSTSTAGTSGSVAAAPSGP